jgi:hypothetical protein
MRRRKATGKISSSNKKPPIPIVDCLLGGRHAGYGGQCQSGAARCSEQAGRNWHSLAVRRQHAGIAGLVQPPATVRDYLQANLENAANRRY